MLAPYKMKITCVESGAEALNLLTNEKFDIVFMDHMMPIMDGVECMYKIREIPGCQYTVVIALTANAISGMKEQWEQDKFYDRLGLESESCDIMGLSVPKVTIPVMPGRNLAVIIEIAAMNNRQKRMGYNTAEEFNRKMLIQAGADPDTYGKK